MPSLCHIFERFLNEMDDLVEKTRNQYKLKNNDGSTRMLSPLSNLLPVKNIFTQRALFNAFRKPHDLFHIGLRVLVLVVF
jgi:hypothetical protein